MFAARNSLIWLPAVHPYIRKEGYCKSRHFIIKLMVLI